MNKILGMAAMVAEVTVSVIGEVIEFWGTGQSREDMASQIRKHAARAENLAHELERLQEDNSYLREEIDGLKFNGSEIYSDEAEALKKAREMLLSAGYLKYSDAIALLLERSDLMPVTRAEFFASLEEDVRSAKGETEGAEW